LSHLPLLELAAAILVLNPLASAFCAVKMRSAATTIMKPSGDLRARVTTVGLVSIDMIAEATKNLKELDGKNLKDFLRN
jgi:hypothetical protein